MKQLNLDCLVKSEDLFNSLSNENEQPKAKPFEYKIDENLEFLINGFKRYENCYPYEIDSVNEYDCVNREKFLNEYFQYKTVLAKDIEQFSMIIGNFKGMEKFGTKSGYYFNRLFERCKEDYIKLRFIDNTGEKVLCLCDNNKINRKYEIFGNIGPYLGSDLKNGTIIVNGDCVSNVGKRISGGKIIINGNVLIQTGFDSTGGEIVINGNLGTKGFHSEISGLYGGSIYLKGDLIGHIYSIECGKLKIDGKISGEIYTESIKSAICHKGKMITKRRWWK